MSLMAELGEAPPPGTTLGGGGGGGAPRRYPPALFAPQHVARPIMPPPPCECTHKHTPLTLFNHTSAIYSRKRDEIIVCANIIMN